MRLQHGPQILCIYRTIIQQRLLVKFSHEFFTLYSNSEIYSLVRSLDIMSSGCHNKKDILIQNVQINYCNCIERKEKKDSSSCRDCKLLLSEDRFEVVRIDYGIASISPFRIDILPSSESIWFGAKTTRTEPDDKIELREVLRLLCLPPDQYLGSRKVLNVFMICNNVDGIGWTF